MRKELIAQYKKAISPANKIEDLYLQTNKFITFADHYAFSGEILGAGGFGVVVLATDKHFREDVAIKILNIGLYLSTKTNKSKNRLADLEVERSLSFLENEVNIIQQLEHPSIIKVKNIYKSQYHVLIVMELAKCSLADYISKHGRLTEEESKVILKQILNGLKYLHISNIVHRDLKPGNILLMSDKNLEGAIKISDFSISANLTKALPFELTDTVGTFLYKAPEQFTSEGCTTVR
jgi:calcium/calmodulin-dependent protein kinase I